MSCLAKRSQFLRGRNLTRDSQADGAPKALLGPAPHTGRGASFFPRQSDTGAHASKNPGGKGQSPRNWLPIHKLYAEPSNIVIPSPSKNASTHTVSTRRPNGACSCTSNAREIPDPRALQVRSMLPGRRATRGLFRPMSCVRRPADVPAFLRPIAASRATPVPAVRPKWSYVTDLWLAPRPLPHPNPTRALPRPPIAADCARSSPPRGHGTSVESAQ